MPVLILVVIRFLTFCLVLQKCIKTRCIVRYRTCARVISLFGLFAQSTRHNCADAALLLMMRAPRADCSTVLWYSTVRVRVLMTSRLHNLPLGAERWCHQARYCTVLYCTSTVQYSYSGRGCCQRSGGTQPSNLGKRTEFGQNSPSLAGPTVRAEKGSECQNRVRVRVRVVLLLLQRAWRRISSSSSNHNQSREQSSSSDEYLSGMRVYCLLL